MQVRIYKEILIRDIDLLLHEIKSFPNEESLWEKRGAVNNSAGNLVLHLCGNLRHFIGAVIGENGYLREREKEFSAENVLRNKLIAQIENLKLMVSGVLDKKNDDWLNAEYPAEFAGRKRQNGEMLLILATHFSYHLGQVNYLRRML